MKILLNNEDEPKELVGKLSEDGTLFLRYNNSHRNGEVNTVTLSPLYGNDCKINSNGSAKVEQMNGTPIYKGDTITITF